MEEQYKKTFDQMVDSLKMYQRYELKDKNRKDILDKSSLPRSLRYLQEQFPDGKQE